MGWNADLTEKIKDEIRNSQERKDQDKKRRIRERLDRQIIRIFPSSDAIPFEALQLAKEGIEQYILDPLQLTIPFSFETPAFHHPL
jgi:hypothetical protein